MLDPLSIEVWARAGAQRVWALQAATATMLLGLLAMVPLWMLVSRLARSCLCLMLMGALCQH